MYAPVPPAGSPAAATPGDLSAPRRSGGSRLTAFMSSFIGIPVWPLEVAPESGVVAWWPGPYARKVCEVPADDGIAGEQPGHAAHGEPGAERDRRPAGVADAPARHQRHADDGAGDQRHEQRGSHGGAEEQAHDGGELDVAHAHATRLRDRGSEQEAARQDAGEQMLGQVGGTEDGDQRDGEHRSRGGQLVRDDPVVEVDEGDRDEEEHEGEAEKRVELPSPGQHDGDAQRSGQRLDQRIADRDARPAAAASPAQGEPREHRHVVVRSHRGAARRAARAGSRERLAARQAVGDDVQEGPDGEPQHPGEDGDHGADGAARRSPTAARRRRGPRRR